MSKLSELQRAHELACRAVSDVEGKIANYESSRRLEIAAEVRDKFGDQLQAARQARQAAELAVEDEQDRRARAVTNTPMPIGAQLFEWKHSPFGGGYHKTGRIGVFEVFNKDSKESDNRRWGRPEIGDFVMRFLKKDGTPSLRCERYGDIRRRWLPEGKRPKE